MEYQKIINFLDNLLNKPSKFETKNWVKINDARVEHITQIVKLNLKLQYWSQFYVITMMHTKFWVEL